MRTNFRAAIAVVLLAPVLALTILAPPPAGAVAAPKGARVFVLGDSITIEARGSGLANFWLNRYRVDWSGVRFMSVPCAGLKEAVKLTYVPDVVVINYSGNSTMIGEPCTNAERGSALVAKYNDDIQKLINLFKNGRTRVVIMGAPARATSTTDSELIFNAGRTLAAENGVGFFDGGRFISPDRQPTRAQPCLALIEAGSACGTAGKGKNLVREPSLNHLCPTGGTITGECKVYSSGSVRLALNMVDAIAASKVVNPPMPTLADPNFAPFKTADSYTAHMWIDFLRRSPSTADMNRWRSRYNDGMPKVALADALIKSQEFDDKSGNLIRLYVAFYSRIPTHTEWSYWMAALHNGSKTIGAIGNHIANSAPFKSMADDAFVTMAYQNVFKRAPDSGGKIYWVNRLRSGTSRGAVMASFFSNSGFVSAMSRSVFIAGMYEGMLGRGVDPAAHSSLLSSGKSGLQMVSELYETAEFRDRF